KLVVMSWVALPAVLGTMALSTQELPPSLDTKIGALVLPPGSGVNAVAAIRSGVAGLTVRCGSLSWCCSPLSALGMTFTTSTPVLGGALAARRARAVFLDLPAPFALRRPLVDFRAVRFLLETFFATPPSMPDARPLMQPGSAFYRNVIAFQFLAEG